MLELAATTSYHDFSHFHKELCEAELELGRYIFSGVFVYPNQRPSPTHTHRDSVHLVALLFSLHGSNLSKEMKRQVVRHIDAILTHSPTYWPKDGICARDVDSSIKLHINQSALALHSMQHSRQSISHYCELFSCQWTGFRSIKQLHFTGGGQVGQ